LTPGHDLSRPTPEREIDAERQGATRAILHERPEGYETHHPSVEVPCVDSIASTDGNVLLRAVRPGDDEIRQGLQAITAGVG